MPVRRRIDKRRPTVPPEAWHGIFECGSDHFGDLEPLGLIEPCFAPKGEEDAARAAWDRALRAAWGEIGADYLSARDPRQQARPLPWALEEFGDPATCQ
jgi:hypothetical protein